VPISRRAVGTRLSSAASLQEENFQRKISGPVGPEDCGAIRKLEAVGVASLLEPRAKEAQEGPLAA